MAEDDTVDQLYSSAVQNFQTGHYDTSLRDFIETKRVILSKSIETGLYFQTLKFIGLCYENLGQVREAQASYMEAVTIGGETAEPEEMITIYRHLGLLLADQSKFEESLECFQKCRRLGHVFITLQNDFHLCSIYNSISICFKKLGQIAKGIDFFENELRLLEDAGKINVLYSVCACMGDLHFNLIQSGSTGSLERCFKYFHQLSDKLLVTKIMTSLLKLCDLSEEHEVELKKLLSETADDNIRLAALIGIGSVFQRINRNIEALDYFTKARDTCSNTNERASSILGIANAQLGLAHYTAAIANFQTMVELGKSKNLIEIEALGYEGLRRVHSAKGEYREAFTHCKQTLNIHRSHGSIFGVSDIYSSLSNLAAVAAQMLNQEKDGNIRKHHQQQAMNCYKEMLNIGNYPEKANTLVNIGVLYCQSGDTKRAEEHYEKARSLAETHKQMDVCAEVFVNMSVMAGKSRDPSKAAEYAMKALNILHDLPPRSRNIPLEIDANHAMTLATYLGNNFEEAYRYGRITLAHAERRRMQKRTNDTDRIAFASKYEDVSKVLQIILVAHRMDRQTEALQLAEKSRGVAFLDYLHYTMTTTTREYGIFCDYFRNEMNFKSLTDIVKAANCKVVVYSLISADLLIWVLDPNVGLLESLRCGCGDLSELINSLHKGLRIAGRHVEFEDRGAAERNALPDDVDDDVLSDENTRENSNSILQKIYKILFQPIENAIFGNGHIDFVQKSTDAMKQELIIIPNEDIYLVPFAALMPVPGIHLCDLLNLRVAPSLHVLEFCRMKEKECIATDVPNCLVVGNPDCQLISVDGKSIRLAELPGAEREANYVSSLLGVSPLIGPAATKANVLERLPKADFVHFACHGSWEKTALFLAPQKIDASSTCEEDSCLLTDKDILDIKLSAKLVVLSACNSGNGNIRSEGVVGLSRAFLMAGAKSVLVAIWQLPDASTEKMITDMYKGILGGLSISCSLSHVMRKLKALSGFEHPLYWAAFTAYGEDITVDWSENDVCFRFPDRPSVSSSSDTDFEIAYG